MLMRGTPRGLWVALTVGAIGQVSILNSFCHLHTPLTLTLLRVFNGLWVGALAGIILCVVWDLVSRRIAPERRDPSPAEEQ
jgi:MFS family permease